jgi:uncharacterized protein YndB with AHSA1/START domain
MSDGEHLTARFISDGARVSAALRLTLDADVEAVWAALTVPDQLAQWLAPGEIELRPGGAACLAFGASGVVIDSAVTAVEPERLLEYSWSGPGEALRPIRWELQPLGARTLLNLTVTLPAHEDVARSTAGWAAHLEMLAGHLAGASVQFPLPTFRAARADYAEQLAALSRTAARREAVSQGRRRAAGLADPPGY